MIQVRGAVQRLRDRPSLATLVPAAGPMASGLQIDLKPPKGFCARLLLSAFMLNIAHTVAMGSASE